MQVFAVCNSNFLSQPLLAYSARNLQLFATWSDTEDGCTQRNRIVRDGLAMMDDLRRQYCILCNELPPNRIHAVFSSNMNTRAISLLSVCMFHRPPRVRRRASRQRPETTTSKRTTVWWVSWCSTSQTTLRRGARSVLYSLSMRPFFAKITTVRCRLTRPDIVNSGALLKSVHRVPISATFSSSMIAIWPCSCLHSDVWQHYENIWMLHLLFRR